MFSEVLPAVDVRPPHFVCLSCRAFVLYFPLQSVSSSSAPVGLALVISVILLLPLSFPVLNGTAVHQVRHRRHSQGAVSVYMARCSFSALSITTYSAIAGDIISAHATSQGGLNDKGLIAWRGRAVRYGYLFFTARCHNTARPE